MPPTPAFCLDVQQSMVEEAAHGDEASRDQPAIPRSSAAGGLKHLDEVEQEALPSLRRRTCWLTPTSTSRAVATTSVNFTPGSTGPLRK